MKEVELMRYHLAKYIHSLIIGFDPSKILYTGNNVTDEELKYAVNSGVRINLDSISQLQKLSKIPEARWNGNIIPCKPYGWSRSS